MNLENWMTVVIHSYKMMRTQEGHGEADSEIRS